MTLKRSIFIICGLLGFIIIAYFVKSYDILSFDSCITDAVYSIRGPALTAILMVITFSANWQTITLICIIVLFLKRTRKTYGYPLALTAIMSSILYKTIKDIIARARPDEAVRLIYETGFSYPSGHSMTGLVFYGLIIYFVNVHMENKKAAKIITALLSILILLIGFSRIYLGVHYPTDVLGGFSFGIAFLFFLLLCNDAYFERITEKG